MRKSATSIIYVALLMPALLTAQPVKPIPSFSEPSVAPDGKEIAFVSGGDIWTVSSQGGEANLLISHSSFESRPLYSPDGKSIAFSSTRSGNGDVYIFQFATGELKRLTFDDAAEEASGWSPDSKTIFFSSSGKDISGMADVFAVSSQGGTPVAIIDEPYTNEFFATASQDATTIAFNAHGVASRQWWRNGHSHLDESEIWLYKIKGRQFEKFTADGAKDLWPMWSADSKTLYYMSDRSGHENIWVKPIKGEAQQLTKFTDGRVLWPSISHDGKMIAFEKDFKIWRLEIASGKAEPIEITKRGSASTPPVEHLRLTSQFNSLALSPDGRKLVFITHGELFAGSVKDGGDALRLTNSVDEESQPMWSPDSKSIVYVRSADGQSSLYQYDFANRMSKRLTTGSAKDECPVFSPDGKSIAFLRDGKQLRIFDTASGKDKAIASGHFSWSIFSAPEGITWSPDNKWIAYAAYGTKGFRNAYVVPAAGGASRQISFLPNAFGSKVIWSSDGRSIYLNTRQRTENTQIAKIDLMPKTPLFQEDRFQDLFNEPVPAEKKVIAVKNDKPVAKDSVKVKPSKSTMITFDGINRRSNMMPIGMDIQDMQLSHDGKLLIFIATVAGQSNLYSYTLDELAKEPAVAKQITSTAGQKSDPYFTPDDKEVVYLEQGKVFKVPLENRQAKAIDLAAEMNVDFTAQKVKTFRQAWDVQNDYFYDSLHHGKDWNKVKQTFEPIAAGTQTQEDLRRVISLMLGELNASHSGISGPPSSNVTSGGRTGLKFDADEFARSGKLKVSSVISLSPADVSASIKPGDFILGVDDTLLTSSINFDQLLLDKIGKRVGLMVSSSGLPKDLKKVFLLPVNQATEKRLLYREWAQHQRDYVARISNGRLGYVHIFDMGAESLTQLYLDLDTENHSREGVVVDVRNNNGGFVNAYALDVLSRQGYMSMAVRGFPAAPARTQLGQRALEAPTILVTNQHSLSDAEDFTEGYKTLGLGKVVGEPTGGWIIYTSAVQLIDGSILRLPFIRITDHEGKNMELAPRTVDIPVSRALGESAQGKDSQLDVAVKTLLNQLDSGKTKAGSSSGNR